MLSSKSGRKYVVADGLDPSRVTQGEPIRLGRVIEQKPWLAFTREESWPSVAGRRAFDIVLALFLIIAFAPLMLVTALAIRLESRGPVIFRQRRTGLYGRQFELFKFRSMFSEAADTGGSVQTSRYDARVTRVGRFIRRTSIDELPQLVNVLLGSMSIVGPRPHALETHVEGLRLEAAVPNYGLRHRVKPGLTGLAQISGLRGELDSIHKLRSRVNLDLEYINRRSIIFDFWILILTAWRIICDPTAY